MTADEETLAALRLDWPQWHVWTVRRVYGPTAWCARRWDHGDDAARSISADTADELAQMMEDAVSP